jgi:hypothetical protein
MKKVTVISEQMWKKSAELMKIQDLSLWLERARELGLNWDETVQMKQKFEPLIKQIEAEFGDAEQVFEIWDWHQWFQLIDLLESVVQMEDSPSRILAIPLLKQIRFHSAYPVYVEMKQNLERVKSETAPLGERSWERDQFAHKVQKIEEAQKAKNYLLLPKNFSLESTSSNESQQREDKKIMNVYFVHKVLFLEGALSVIIEDPRYHTLLAHKISDLPFPLSTKPLDRLVDSPITSHDIDEYVRSIRSMNDAEIRLIMKVKDPALFTSLPAYHHLSKPYLVTNGEGDLIWAAYVEPCADLFEWIYSLEGHAEIMDPVDFKQQYQSYVKMKKRQTA